MLDVSLVLLFFFSSRRRHTRWPRDWSSDVCSSDLPRRPHGLNTDNTTARPNESKDSAGGKNNQVRSAATGESCAKRSEERRVGKESRLRWSAYHIKRR